MNYNMSLEQKIHSCEAFIDIEREWSTHVFYHAIEDRPGFTSTYRWSHRENCAGTHGFGCLVGYDRCEVEWRTGIYEGTDMELPIMRELYPDLEDNDDYFGFAVHNLCSSVIEVAEDGMSARSSFYTPGLIGRPSTPKGNVMLFIMWERYGQDWVFEDGDFKTGEWRLLHNRVAEDFNLWLNGANYAADEYRKLMETGEIVCPMMSQESPRNIEILGPTHFDLSLAQLRQFEPSCPKPYKTFDETEHYIPPQGTGYRVIRVFDNGKN